MVGSPIFMLYVHQKKQLQKAKCTEYYPTLKDTRSPFFGNHTLILTLLPHIYQHILELGYPFVGGTAYL